MTASRDSCWPTPLQELLVKATILDRPAAKEAWERWAVEADFDRLDEGSNRLLPETYTNLIANGVDHPLFARMKGMKRRTWLENQLLFHQATAAIEILDKRGIQTMITKGPALVLRHYGDHGRRPMADFDLVVRSRHARQAVEALRSNGFTLIESDRWDSGDVGLLHAVTCVNDMGRQFDLHWHVISGCTLEEPFWERAEPVSINRTKTLAPTAADLLLQVCVHGLRPNPVPPLRWIVDANIIFKEADVDWDRLVRIARQLRFSYRMREALGYLTRFGYDIPTDVFDRLLGGDPLGHQRREFARLTRLREKSVSTEIATGWLAFRRYADNEQGGLRLKRLPDFLRHRWKMEKSWKLPAVAVQKTFARLMK